ncbi:MAG: ABC transporter ATP-binding protein [Proteobacteria bacterium]|nr:ABC transporter ATP-binding protein [Pseudomonadota bacterium]
MNVAIQLDNVGKSFRKSWRGAPFEALRGVSLEIAQGESFGFIGPNGAGKSTTIKILTGGIAPTTGEARLFGLAVSDPRARAGLGYVPENPSLPDYMTPMEILRMGVRLHGLKFDDETGHCMDWLERFQLGAVAHKVIRGFSKGMVQRTALAHALAVRPRLLILDEPLSGLDPMGRREVVDILANYRAQGGTLFFSSHVLFDVERLADRYGLIHRGRLRAVSSPAELVGGDDLVTIRSQGGTQLPAQVAEPGGRWAWELARAEQWKALEAIRAAGQELIEVRPRLSLESAFIHVIENECGGVESRLA